MSHIAPTPKPTYYAVIFTSVRTEGDQDNYAAMADKMVQLAAEQPGFLGIESAREGIGITVSYWQDLESIKQWKANAEHLLAQKLGREQWYRSFKTRIAKVEREYGF
ncbi:antibiotic biosynthesis monooxygenase [Alkalimonas sp. MEB108]|uniref:Antibiotic biosynthesis monooxygenase n=1 Tax=Alkalimonas cellulosilytica TaxID=3058395 RepID=A0ABU7J7X9_9GAMM|nr:antibiotic biosynthesis monooxygenase [Alkalimonas sp. MEB108]MEE2002388.1 antibiotic biosynthesis monooxygenase [Alkalimonas sp. MEB108]